MSEKESKQTNCKELLEKFLNDDDVKKYLAMKPTTRHEAWLLGTTLSLLCLLDLLENEQPSKRRRLKI